MLRKEWQHFTRVDEEMTSSSKRKKKGIENKEKKGGCVAVWVYPREGLEKGKRGTNKIII